MCVDVWAYMFVCVCFCVCGVFVFWFVCVCVCVVCTGVLACEFLCVYGCMSVCVCL